MTQYNDTFTVSPMNQRIELEPGEVYQGHIKVGNPATAKSELKYQINVTPLGFAGEDYDADLVTESNYTQITNWITIDEPTGTLKPNEFKEITFSINVPKDVPAGGQYASLLVSRDDGTGENDNAVEIGSVLEMASLLYARVNGKTRKEGEVVRNDIPSFATGGPINTTIVVKNNGNVDSVMTPVVMAKNFFTGEVIIDGSDKSTYESEIVMPETTRAISKELNNMPALGVVRVEQTVYYDGKPISSESKDLIICPIWFMILVATALIVIIEIIILLVKKHKAKKHKAKKEE